MARHSNQAIAEAFWERAGGRSCFGSPVAIERAAVRTLPVAVHRLNGLNTAVVSDLLARVGADPWTAETPRELHGCLIADAGKALVVVDRDDPEDEQRMTVAHELAHLLLHYLMPRDEAVTVFGPEILAVLDRTRAATLGERMSSLLRNVPIEPYRHAMDRRPLHARGVSVVEDEADDLAIELLAPWRELQCFRGASHELIQERFALPAAVAIRLAGLITPPRTSTGVLHLFGSK